MHEDCSARDVRCNSQGKHGIYIVYYSPRRNYLRCTCPASYYGRLCKHALAVKTYIDALLESRNKGQPKPPSPYGSASE
ncbi:SWIM zinc finger family protein [Pyrodictium occultum]|uniref:SWIM zinc finger family protein n=1 Tax=Pyrodictium occultum TaxID=2309 RepID=UPI0009F859C6